MWLYDVTQVLDLRFNELTVVHADAFSGVRNLSVILLDDNHIHRVEPHAFRGLTAVRLLSLTGNRITTVTGNSFSDLSGRKDVCAAMIGINCFYEVIMRPSYRLVTRKQNKRIEK